MRRVRQKCRGNSGTAVIELACGSVLIMVLLMLALDITIMLLGFQLNDRACRAAARAAAQQSSSSDAMVAINAALKVHQGDGLVVSSPILSPVDGGFVYQDFDGNPYGGNPTVSVVTEVEVKVPVPLFFFNERFGTDSVGFATTWKFRKRYTYPITNVGLVLPAI